MNMSKGEQGKGQHGQAKKHLVKKVISAVSKSGINSAQAQKVTDAINAFKQEKMETMAAAANKDYLLSLRDEFGLLFDNTIYIRPQHVRSECFSQTNFSEINIRNV